MTLINPYRKINVEESTSKNQHWRTDIKLPTSYNWHDELNQRIDIKEPQEIYQHQLIYFDISTSIN